MSMHDKAIINKSYLLETIIRNRIKDSIFYKQYLTLTNEQTILPVIVDKVDYINGLDGNQRPSPFICCLLRLLEINPSSKILSIYLHQTKFKYLISLVLMFIRLTKPALEIYTLFDSYVTNYAKLRIHLANPQFHNGIAINYAVTYMDAWVDDLLRQQRVVDIILPRLEPRYQLVDKGLIGDRQYFVTVNPEKHEDEDEDEEEEEEEEAEEEKEEDESFISDSD